MGLDISFWPESTSTSIRYVNKSQLLQLQTWLLSAGDRDIRVKVSVIEET